MYWSTYALSSKAEIIGADFCHPMLVSAKRKMRQIGY